MKAQRSTVLCLLAALAVMFLNAVVFYSVYCSGEVLSIKDIYAVKYTVDAASCESKRKIISALPSDNAAAILSVEDKISYLEDVKAAVKYKSGDYYALGRWEGISKEEQKEKAQRLYDEYRNGVDDPNVLLDLIDNERKQMDDVLSVCKNAANYKSYIDGIISNADTLSQINIYKENSFAQSNFIKTRNDFSKLSDMEIPAVCEGGSIIPLNCRFTDVFALFLTVITVMLAFEYGRKRNKDSIYYYISLKAPALILVLFISIMYLSNYILTASGTGVLPLYTPVQAISAFRNCPYRISYGMLHVFTFVFKLLGCLTVFVGLCALLFPQEKKYIARSVAAAFVIISFAAAVNKNESPLFVFFREINIFSMFSFERFYIRYLNLNIAGGAVSRLPIFTVYALVLFFGCALLARKGIAGGQKYLAAQAERVFYDEIDRRYTESRKIRHDINNHLLAISALIESGRSEDAIKYISQVSEANDLAAMPVKTGAGVLDALLFKKCEQAKEQDTQLDFAVNCAISQKGISDYDLCSVFGNIIDNALEAVRALDGDKRVEVVIEKQLDMLYIRCQNPFSGQLKIQGGKLLSSKADSSSHGYGMTRVRDIAEKHGGEVKISCDDGIFTVEILMNM